MLNEPLWMAPQGVENEKNVHFWARTNFQIDEIPTHLTLQIGAESLYRAWCNGVEIGVGPARGTKTLAFFDALEIGGALQAGENRLEILVGCAGVPTFKAAPLRPALWAQIEGIELDWQVARAEEWARETPFYTFQSGFCEWHDGGKTARDWGKPVWFSLPKGLLPRDCAPLQTTLHTPQNGLFPMVLEAGEWQIFDFGRVITGGARVEIEAPEGALVEFGYEECVENGALRLRHEHAHMPGGGYTFCDQFRTRAGRQTLGPTLQERGFRMVQIRALQSAEPLRIHAIEAIDRRHPLPPLQNRETDPFRRRLLEMAHHTVSSCATDVLTDCPWREAAFWANDFVVNARYWLSLGGDPALIERCLRLSFSEPSRDGLIHGVCPTIPKGGSYGEIVFLSTNTFLPLVLKDLAEFGGNIAPFLAPTQAVFDALEAFGDSDGLLVSPARFWNFLDWSFIQNGWEMNERAGASQSWFYVLGLDALARLTGETRWGNRAGTVARALQTRFWDEQRGCFREFENDDKASQLAQALAILSGRCNAQKSRLLERLSDDSLLEPELYMTAFLLRAWLQNGREDLAWARVEKRWGPIVASDSPAIWEANVHAHGKAAMQNSGSLCHAFSCAPLLLLTPRRNSSHSNPL